VLSVVTCLFAGVRHLYLSQSHTLIPPPLDGVRTPGRSSSFTVYVKRYLLMPAFLGKPNARRPSIFGLTLSIPTRLQTMLVVCYVGLNVIALCVRYRLFIDNTSSPGDESGQLIRYVADRSGILAFAYVPFHLSVLCNTDSLMLDKGTSRF
jgi:hypothetical protein